MSGWVSFINVKIGEYFTSPKYGGPNTWKKISNSGFSNAVVVKNDQITEEQLNKIMRLDLRFHPLGTGGGFADNWECFVEDGVAVIE